MSIILCIFATTLEYVAEMFDFFKKNKEPQKLCVTTDIHCHVVPGIDDGSPDAVTSADLVERMQRWGITRIIASPHVTEASFENTPQIMDNALASLKEELDRRGNGIDISHSAEYRIDDYFFSQIENDNLCPLPGNFLLIENSFIQEPWDLDRIVFDLKIKGFKPILAHPERYFYYAEGHRDRYKKLHVNGLMFQINLLSLAGHYGKAEKNTAEYLLENDMVDFIGSDLHNHTHADSIDAYLSSRDYQRHLRHLIPRNDSI